MLNNEIYKQLSKYKIDGAEGFLSNYEGARKSRQKGQSQEFSDFRPYYPGDDIRLIDWNVYARTEQYHIKLYEEEREARITIILDHSGSMGQEEKKKQMAENLTLMLAYVGLASGDGVRLVTQNSEGQFCASHFYKGIHQFHEYKKTVNQLSWDREIQFDSLTKEMTFHKGITIWISDFLFEGFDTMHQQFKFHQQHLLAIQVLSKETLAPAYDGMLELVDVETKTGMEVHCTEKTLALYHERLNNYLEGIQQLTSKAGDRYLLVDVDEEGETHLLQKLITHNILR